MKLLSALITALIAVLLAMFNGQLLLGWKLVIILLLLVSAMFQIKSHLNEMARISSARRAGVLTARTRPIFPFPEEVTIELGWDPCQDHPGVFFVYKGGPLSRMLSNPAFKVLADLNFGINETGGQIRISMLVRGKSGKIIAKLVNNNWEVAPPPKTWDKNFSKDTLEIIDDNGYVVLQVRYLADRVQLNGIFYDESGSGVSIAPGSGEYAEIKVLNQSSVPAKINPIFKYPSEKFFGQLGDMGR